jgi:PAS domain-containing protein
MERKPSAGKAGRDREALALPQPDRRRVASVPAWALDDVPFGVGLLNASDLVFVYANRLFESWFAADKRKILGRRLDEAPGFARRLVDVFKRVAESGEAAHFFDAEFIGLKDRPVELPGHVTKWDWSIWPVKDPDGRLTHLLVFGYDVTAPALERLHLSESHEEGVRALLEVSRLAGATGTIEDFFGELSATVARVVRAEKVVFSKAQDGLLVARPRSYGFDDELLSGITVPCSPDGDGLADRVVFGDYVFRASIDSSPEFEPYRAALEIIKVSNAMAVAWRAGDLRLGIVAAFNSARPGGFGNEDVHLLKTASMAAGLVWQHRQAEARLEEALSKSTPPSAA